MFGNNNRKEVTRTNNSLPTGSNLNSLAVGTRVEGTIHAENDIRIDGTITGKLYCSAKVIIGPTGKIDGDIQCQNAVIEGQFEGNLQVVDELQVMQKAKVSGELTAARLVVQPGAVINGSFDMTSGNKQLSTSNRSTKNGLPEATESRKIVESTNNRR